VPRRGAVERRHRRAARRREASGALLLRNRVPRLSVAAVGAEARGARRDLRVSLRRRARRVPLARRDGAGGGVPRRARHARPLRGGARSGAPARDARRAERRPAVRRLRGSDARLRRLTPRPPCPLRGRHRPAPAADGHGRRIRRVAFDQSSFAERGENAMLRIGWVMTALVVLFLLGASVAPKLTGAAAALDALAALAWPSRHLLLLGVLELACVVLYA